MPRILLSVVGVLFSSTLLAQQRPDFSGTWVMDMTRSGSAAQGAYVSPRTPVTLVIVQTPSGLTVQTDVDGTREVVAFKPEGPEADLPRPVGTSGLATVDRSPRAVGSGGVVRPVEQPTNDTGIVGGSMEWKDTTLVTTTNYKLNGMAVTKLQTRSLNSNGREMVIETQVTVQHGYESRARRVSQPY